jgi:peptidoglycan/LPS O-acetylase OafA/YrhL
VTFDAAHYSRGTRPGLSFFAKHIRDQLTTNARGNGVVADKPGATRLRSIDALRGAAALAVVLYHALSNPRPSSGLFARFVTAPTAFLTSYGYTGVFLFFVISGFCIHLAQAKASARGRGAERVEFFSFWRRRVRRLYPPYLVALVLYLAVARATGHLPLTQFFAWDFAAHLLMLHNFDTRTCYSINSVFWTLAIEEQLYLAYFLLLFLRRRFGWMKTLAVCLAARVACFALLTVLRKNFGVDVPIPEAALSHWFTWALGALAVEAAFGIVQLPRWTRSLRVGALALFAAAALARVLPLVESHVVVHDAGWLLLHPLWGVGFFCLLNRAVEAERGWRAEGATPAWIARLSAVGLVSYSLYLTHQLVLLETWKFESIPMPAMLVALIVMVPLCLTFAWLFFRLFERPFLARGRDGTQALRPAHAAEFVVRELRAEEASVGVVAREATL